MRYNILITGGSGFIGSHVVRLFVNKYPNYKIFNVDSLTYAGNNKNLEDLKFKDNYKFIKKDICDFQAIKKIFIQYRINAVIHLAAESHVDNSIKNPLRFAQTNVLGTLSLLQAATEIWANDYSKKLFYHISTDEVYGSLNNNDFFKENTKYNPRSPYSASKASSDHFVRAFNYTFSIPVIISHSSNNYGKSQLTEKFIPMVIKNIINNKPISVYGDGQNIRDWLFVEDHVKAIDTIFHKAKRNETYNIGGENEWKNIDLVEMIIGFTDKKLGRMEGSSRNLITFVDDRLGHDYRYAIDNNKITSELGWKPSTKFKCGIQKTIDWYINN